MIIRGMGHTLSIGFVAAGLFLGAVASASAFTRENVQPDGGNYSFTDPDQKITSPDSQNSSQTRPFGSAGPVVQFGVQQGPVTTFGQGNRYNTPDPYFRPLTNGN
jgi:hypothetical protein